MTVKPCRKETHYYRCGRMRFGQIGSACSRAIGALGRGDGAMGLYLPPKARICDTNPRRISVGGRIDMVHESTFLNIPGMSKYNADMRNQLGYWFRKPEAEERALWQSGLFSFDASVLLNIYAYSNETRDELMKLIEANAERVRLPHQFGLEYSRNRASVIIKQVNNYLKADKDLQDFQTKHLEPKREHPHLSNESVEVIKAVRDDLSGRKKQMESFISADPYANRVLDVFEGKLGPIPTPEELGQLHIDAAARYAKNCPPPSVPTSVRQVDPQQLL